jgi:hypothetical protein
MGIKITDYPNTQTTFDDLDLFDVSAYVAPGVDFETRKYSWSTLVSEIQAAVLPSGTNGQIMAHNSTQWIATSNIFIDFTTNKVGIGTATPINAFHVKANVSSPTFRDNVCYFQQANTSALRANVQLDFGSYIEYGVVNGTTPQTGYGDASDVYLKGGGNDLNIINGATKNINFYVDNSFLVADNPAFQINASGITARETLYAKGPNDDYSGLTLYASSLFQIVGGYMWNSIFQSNGYSSGLIFQAYGLTSPGAANAFLEVEIDGQTIQLLGKV